MGFDFNSSLEKAPGILAFSHFADHKKADEFLSQAEAKTHNQQTIKGNAEYYLAAELANPDVSQQLR